MSFWEIDKKQKKKQKKQKRRSAKVETRQVFMNVLSQKRKEKRGNKGKREKGKDISIMRGRCRFVGVCRFRSLF